MRPSTFLPILFCVAVLMLDTAGSVVGVRFPHPAASIVIGFCLGQAALAAAWLAFSPWSFLIRLTVVAAFVTLLAEVLARISDPDRQEWMAVLSVLVAAVTIPALRLRWLGVGLVAESDNVPQNGGTGRPWQFSVAALLMATAGVAFMLAWAQWIRFPWKNAHEVLLYVVGFVAVAWIGLWSALYRGSLWWWLPFAAAAAVAIGAGISTLSHQTEVGFAICTLAEALVIVAAIAVLRISGWRVRGGRA